eukprot:8103581-Prorocentrum_lima.AAC.1
MDPNMITPSTYTMKKPNTLLLRWFRGHPSRADFGRQRRQSHIACWRCGKVPGIINPGRAGE